MSNTQNAKNGARLATFDAPPANRSKKPISPVTSLGIMGSWWDGS
jgi:hypothetical protein